MQNDLSLKIWTQWGNVLRIVLNQMHEDCNRVHRVSPRTSISLVTMNTDNKDHPQLGKNSNRKPNTKYKVLGPVSQKSRKHFGPEKPFVKLWLVSSFRPVFWYVVNRMKIKTTAKFRASRRLRFKDTKIIMSPELRPKSFGTFEKRTPNCSRRG